MDMFSGHGTIPAMLALVAFVSLTGAAALRDVTGLAVPNSMILWLLAGYGILAPLSGLSPREMLVALGVAAMVFFASVAAVALGWIGGEDSRFLTVVALWLGPQAVPWFLLLTLGLCGLAALALLSVRLRPATGALRRTGAGTPSLRGRLATKAGPDRALPVSLCAAAAALLSLPVTPWLAGP